MKNKGLWMLLGFLLVIFGLTAIILQVIGTQWAFLQFLEAGGRLLAFVVKIILVMAGFIIYALASTDWDQERRESGG